MKNWIQYSVKTMVVGASPLLASVVAANGIDKPVTNKSLVDFFDVAFVHGTIYDDKDGDGRKDLFEQGMDGVVVYLDENDNGVRDYDEIATKTNAAGRYFFKVPTGDYAIRQEVPFGFRNTAGGEGDDAVPTVIDQEQRITPKIIGGKEVDIEQYPFMVAMGQEFGGSFFQFCGGVLISDRWVATAAHCSDFVTPEGVQVLAGTNNVTDGSGMVLQVEDVILHPNYLVEPIDFGSPFSVAAGYDIALWKLAEPIALAESGLQTVSMLTDENSALAVDGALATTVGWGVSDIGSTLLQDVNVPIYDTPACQDVYFDSVNFNTQICAGAPEGGIDACQGDSGGPLLVRDFDAEEWRLAGITSYGNGCALPGNPGVWARVSELSEWAMRTAVEDSRHYDVALTPFKFVKADFGNQPSTYQISEEIDPRWQLVNAELTEVDSGVQFDWRIIDESFVPRAFDCALDGDSAGPMPGSNVECYSGKNTGVVPPLEDGIFVSELSASFEGTSFTRENILVFGTPPSNTTTGSLTVEDPFDPDYEPALYYIDYFAIEGLSAEKVVSVRVTSEGIPDLYVGIYDRDVRESLGFGGEFESNGTFGVGASVEFTFFPQPGINYLIGVSSFSQEVVGDYSVTVINEGTPVETTLNVPAEIRRLPVMKRKVPEVKSVVTHPVTQ